MDLNKVIMGGRLVADPELKNLPSGDPVVNFRVATNRRWRDAQTSERREEACFIDVKCFGAKAPVIHEYFKKGSQILIEGHLRQETWEREGEKKSKHVLYLETFSFVDPKEPGVDPKGLGVDSKEQAGEPRQPAERDSEPRSKGEQAAAPAPAASVAKRRRALVGSAAGTAAEVEAARLPF